MLRPPIGEFPKETTRTPARLSLWSRNREGVPQAVASHETALRPHGISDLMPEKVHLGVPKGFRKQPPKGVVLHKADLAGGRATGDADLDMPLPLAEDLLDEPQEAVAKEFGHPPPQRIYDV